MLELMVPVHETKKSLIQTCSAAKTRGDLLGLRLADVFWRQHRWPIDGFSMSNSIHEGRSFAGTPTRAFGASTFGCWRSQIRNSPQVMHFPVLVSNFNPQKMAKHQRIFENRNICVSKFHSYIFDYPQLIFSYDRYFTVISTMFLPFSTIFQRIFWSQSLPGQPGSRQGPARRAHPGMWPRLATLHGHRHLWPKIGRWFYRHLIDFCVKMWTQRDVLLSLIDLNEYRLWVWYIVLCPDSGLTFFETPKQKLFWQAIFFPFQVNLFVT